MLINNSPTVSASGDYHFFLSVRSGSLIKSGHNFSDFSETQTTRNQTLVGKMSCLEVDCTSTFCILKALSKSDVDTLFLLLCLANFSDSCGQK